MHLIAEIRVLWRVFEFVGAGDGIAAGCGMRQVSGEGEERTSSQCFCLRQKRLQLEVKSASQISRYQTKLRDF